MTRHVYPAAALLGDYARAIIGLVLCGTPLALLSLNPYVAAVFALLALLFLVFGIRTALRQLGPIEMNEAAIRSTGLFPRELDWAALDELKLAYYATRRDGKSGWMQLALRARGRKLQLDSRIEDFAEIVRRAVAAAGERRLKLSTATTANLAALGIAAAAEG